MSDRENRAKASILIQYIMNIFREESLQGDVRNPNVELLLMLLEKKGLIKRGDIPCSKKVNDILNKTFFKKINELLSDSERIPPLKRYEVEQEIVKLMEDKSLNLFFCDLLEKNSLTVREFATEMHNVANEYLKTLESLYHSQYIKGKQDAFDSLNVKISAQLNSGNKKKR